MNWLLLSLTIVISYFAVGFSLARWYTPRLWDQVDSFGSKYTEGEIKNWFTIIWFFWLFIMPYFPIRSLIRNEVEKSHPDNLKKKNRQLEDRNKTLQIEIAKLEREAGI